MPRLSSFLATSVPAPTKRNREPVRPHPWPKCRAPYSDPTSKKTNCWHRVPPECIHEACQRAYQPVGGPELPHTHNGGTPCCPRALPTPRRLWAVQGSYPEGLPRIVRELPG